MSKFNIGDRVRITSWGDMSDCTANGQSGTVVTGPHWSCWHGVEVQLDGTSTERGIWPCEDDELELI